MTEATAVQEPVAKQKVKQTGNVITDVATEIENLSKTKALHLADRLVEEIDTESFRLGGVLNLIHTNQWYEGYPTFGAFVNEKYGFQERKARYLIEIYTHLVKKQIPWDTVKDLGWTKLKDLARFLTPENAAEWVEKASKLTVLELQAMLKGQAAEGEKTEKATSDVTVLKFKLHKDQLETVQSALSKGKAEFQTEFDSVALENVMAGYLAGTVTATAASPSPEVFKSMGAEAVLAIFEKAFPEINITVETP